MVSPTPFFFSKGTSSVEVIGKSIYFFCDNSEIWTLDMDTFISSRQLTYGVQLPSGQLHSAKYENTILLWQKDSDAREGFLLTFRNNASSSHIGSLPPDEKVFQKSLLYNVQKLLSEKTFADVIFLVEDQEIPAHRNILMQSKFFENMFKSGMQEAQGQKIPIPDISVKAFNAILESLYCGTVKLDESFAMELIVQADKYALPELKFLCEFELQKHVCMQNLTRLAQITEKAEAPQLEKRIAEFLAENFSKLEESVNITEIPQRMLIRALAVQNEKLK